MAYQTGTASSYLDLMSRLASFASGVSSPDAGSPTLPSTQRWTVLRNTGTELIMQGPGLAASDQIFVGVKAFFNASADYYNWWISGMTGYEAANSFETQPGAHHTGTADSASGPILTLWNSSIPYWFFVNGRRIIIVAKVSTVYVSAYLGLLEAPYASPGQWAYPLMLGGSMAWPSAIDLSSVNLRWSYTGDEMANWFCPRVGAGSFAMKHSSARIRLASGTWCGFSSVEDYTYPGNVFPASGGAKDIRPCPDGSYALFPLIWSTNEPNVLGESTGVNFVSGYANASENTINDGSSTWTVIQNVFRTTLFSYAAFKME